MHRWTRQMLGECLRGTAVLAPFHALVIAYSGAVLVIALWLGKAGALAHGAYFERLAPIYLVTLPAIMLVGAAALAVHRTDDWSSRCGLLRAYANPTTIGHAASGLLALVSFIVFMGSFTTFKNLMPDIRGGFVYDRVQADIDQLLHLGHDPGALVVALLPHPLLRKAIEWNYSVLWSLLGFIPVFFIATQQAAGTIRLRYLITMATTWIVVGSILACLFLSAGPAFYAGVTGDGGRFAAITSFLGDGAEASSAALFQAYLWSSHEAGTSALGTGISAFPSMHVALAMVNALFLRELNRMAGHIGFAYVGLILLSSVYLGWHYAIDGYVSILIVLALHPLMRRLFDRGEVFAPTSRPQGALTPAAPPTE